MTLVKIHMSIDIDIALHMTLTYRIKVAHS